MDRRIRTHRQGARAAPDLRVLGNSPNLSQPFPLGDGDLTASPFAMLFLSSFVDGPLRVLVQ
jgi:hypothetical protein